MLIDLPFPGVTKSGVVVVVNVVLEPWSFSKHIEFS